MERRNDALATVVLVAVVAVIASSGVAYQVGASRARDATWDDALDVAKNVYIRGACEGAIVSTGRYTHGLRDKGLFTSANPFFATIEREDVVEGVLTEIMVRVTGTNSIDVALLDLWSFRDNARLAYPNDEDLRDVLEDPESIDIGTTLYDVVTSFGCDAEIETPEDLPAGWSRTFGRLGGPTPFA